VATRSLIDMAKERGGKDNITAVVVRVVGEQTEADERRAKHLALKQEVLMGMPLFAHLSEREIMRVMQVVEVRSYQPSQQVIREGTRGDELFIMLSGKVKVIKGDAVLTCLGKGEHFGEMALIRSVPRSADVMAEETSEIIVIRRADFFDILRTEHEMAVKLLWQFLGVLADRLDQTSKDLKSAREEIEAEDITAEVFPEFVMAEGLGEEPEEGRPTIPMLTIPKNED
jgi:CRP-like cAMP-binding protein